MNENDSTKYISLHTSITRADFFTGFTFTKKSDFISPSVTIETGINKTFFQQRFYPRVSASVSYRFPSIHKVDLGTIFSYSFSALHQNLHSAYVDFWNEYYIGYYLRSRGKWAFSHCLMSGLMNNRFYNVFVNKRTGANTLGFYFSIGLSYAL